MPPILRLDHLRDEMNNGMHCSVECPPSEHVDEHIPSDLPVSLQEDSPSVSPRSSFSIGRCLSLRSSTDDDAPLPIQAAPVAVNKTQQLRTWRITRDGLVSTMGAFLDKPKTEKDNHEGEGQGIRYASASMQGWRVDMEDAHVVQLSMGDCPAFSSWSFFAVFDGHAGGIAADDAAKHIIDTLMDTQQFTQVKRLVEEREGRLCEESQTLLEQGIKAGFLQLDDKIRNRLDQVPGKDRSGTTAVCAILTPSHIVIANLGDSRAVVSRKGDDSFGTEDHKPHLEKERERIIGAGGSVMIQRVNGALAVSRALGDFEYKATAGLEPAKQQVSAEPDVYVLERTPEKDEFLILACDGVYDVMSNDELCSFVKSRMEVKGDDLKAVCNQVLDACLSKGSRDNMTLLLVRFPAAPTLNEQKRDEEEKHLQLLSAAVQDIVRDLVKSGMERKDVCLDIVVRHICTSRPELIPSESSLRFLIRSFVESMIALPAEASSSGSSPAHAESSTST